MATGRRSRKRRIISPSGAITKLGDDNLLEEILIRLPGPKSAFRFKSVCKRWNSLISAPYFSRRFAHHHQTTLSSAATAADGLLLASLEAHQSTICSCIPMPNDEFRSRSRILDCFKDLLLVGFQHREYINDELDRTYFVCNPFTKQWVSLPLAPQRSADDAKLDRATRLVCLPCNNSEYRFRVMRMDYGVVDVFCSESGEWTATSLDSVRGEVFIDRVTVAIDGKLYWKNRRGQFVVWNPFGPLDDAAFIPAPRIDNIFASFWPSQGALHIVSLQGFVLSVWRWGEGDLDRCWKGCYRVSLNKLTFRFVDCEVKRLELEMLSVVGLHPEKPEIVFLSGFLLNCSRSVVLSCDLRKEELEFVAYGTWSIWDRGVFRPRITLWPSGISSYAKLRNAYNGRFSCWLQPDIQLTS